MAERNLSRILCVSDSFGLPRPGVSYRTTWIALLKERFPDKDFIGLFRRLGNTDMLSTTSYGEYLHWYDPDAVVIQLGICDCSPRYVPTNSKIYKILGALPKTLSTPVWRMVKLRGRRPGCRDVPPERYRRNLSAYVTECRKRGVKKVILVKIGIPTAKMVASNPMILGSIAEYNAIIDDLAAIEKGYVAVCDPLSEGDPSVYTEDGYHPNPQGHSLIAREIAKAIECSRDR